MLTLNLNQTRWITFILFCYLWIVSALTCYWAVTEFTFHRPKCADLGKRISTRESERGKASPFVFLYRCHQWTWGYAFYHVSLWKRCHKTPCPVISLGRKCHWASSWAPSFPCNWTSPTMGWPDLWGSPSYPCTGKNCPIASQLSLLASPILPETLF